MAAGATYTPIASYTATGSVSSYTFSSISGSYTDLIAVISVTSETNAYYSPNYFSMSVQFNGDTGNNYSVTTLEGNGTTAVSQRQSNTNQIYIAGFQAASYTPPFTAIVSFNNYSNAITYKNLLARGSSNAAGSYVGLWRSTAAITSIKFIEPYGGTYGSGTTFSLYGITAA